MRLRTANQVDSQLHKKKAKQKRLVVGIPLGRMEDTGQMGRWQNNVGYKPIMLGEIPQWLNLSNKCNRICI